MNRYEIYWADGSSDTFDAKESEYCRGGLLLLNTENGEEIDINLDQVKMIFSRSLDDEQD